jgi:hypothetical protein
MAAQMKPVSSRATAIVATVERLPLVVRARWARVQPQLRRPGAGEHLGRDELGLRALARGEPWGVLVVPGGLDDQAPGVRVACL